MTTATLNIRTDKYVKEQAEQIFNELGLNMTTAINMFLKSTIREHGIPFSLKIDVPNDVTKAAMLEAKRMLHDPSVKRYSNVEEALKALKE